MSRSPHELFIPPTPAPPLLLSGPNPAFVRRNGRRASGDPALLQRPDFSAGIFRFTTVDFVDLILQKPPRIVALMK